ncbi:MAG: alginate export family protein [Bdellovibrionales bacterium]
MRKLVALAALLVGMPVAHAAEVKGDVSMNAEYRLRYLFEQARTGDKDADTNENNFAQRMKFDLNFKASEKFSAFASFIHNTDFGSVAAGNNDQIPDTISETGNVNNTENVLLVNQAYAVWMMNDAWTFKVGRGGFTMADGSVMSLNDWQSTPYAFHGGLLNWEKENFRASFYGVKVELTGAGTTGNDDPETNFFGVSFDWKALPEFLKMANIGVSKINGDRTSAVARRDELRYHLVLAGDTANVDYKLNYAAHTGETEAVAAAAIDKKGSMYALEVGYSMPEMMKSRFYVGYHVDSGGNAANANQERYDSFYYEKHATSGMMDVVAWGNLTFIKAGYTLSPMDQVDVGLHYWKFSSTESDDNNVANINGSGFTFNRASNGGSTSDDVGQEIDLSVTKKYDGGFAISSYIGAFMPGAYLKDVSATDKDDTYMQVFVEGKMTF